MSDCLFCKIIAGQIPALKVFEDDFAVAFLDIQPVSLGHTLVVPKAHHQDLTETPDEALGRLFGLVKKVAAAAVRATGAEAFNVGVNTGSAAGQVIMHTHVHVMPRAAGDGLKHWPKKPVAEADMKAAAENIRKLL
jgi:histidine triad (HIT) family protein